MIKIEFEYFNEDVCNCVYKITNMITEQIYIGKTIHPLVHRIKAHHNSYKKSNKRLAQNLREYESENFVCQPIHVLDNQGILTSGERRQLIQLETKYIKLYDATGRKGLNTKNGYNDNFDKRRTNISINNINIINICYYGSWIDDYAPKTMTISEKYCSK